MGTLKPAERVEIRARSQRGVIFIADEQHMNTLPGKTALVTGAASGIGRASALLFASAGAAVVALDLAAEVETTASAIRAAGGRAIALVKDSSSEDDIAAAVALAVREFGALDVCYANAGISGGMPYSASKAGVISLVQTAANQLTGTGVRINAICPGLIETGMTRPIFEQARARGSERKIGQLNPLRRSGVPDEIAQTALFLASDASSYINGQAIAVDGGLSTSHPIVIRSER
jgi:NAD(P)-dependent dehydrogenase (short-subunit alcohol dehydrogenase family)